MPLAPARARFATAAGLLALTTTACGSVGEAISERAVEEIAEQAAGQGVDIDVDDEGGRMLISSSEGTLDIGGGELPDGFPDDLPLPPGHEVLGSMTQADDQRSSMTVTTSTTADFTQVVDDLRSGLEDGGWTIEDTSELTSGDFASTTFRVTRGAWDGSVSVNTADPDVTVAYVLEQGAA
jgi:hypothetical protein